ncbi:MAG: hypothetical protein PHS46_07855 [Candidatus Omnitrophica bacterium]|nr:hypothetical protein [Candidatus Omnitrophota bacterium]
MQDLLARILIEKWPAIIYILPGDAKPFLAMIDYRATGRGETMEAALIGAIQEVDNVTL